MRSDFLFTLPSGAQRPAKVVSEHGETVNVLIFLDPGVDVTCGEDRCALEEAGIELVAGRAVGYATSVPWGPPQPTAVVTEAAGVEIEAEAPPEEPPEITDEERKAHRTAAYGTCNVEGCTEPAIALNFPRCSAHA